MRVLYLYLSYSLFAPRRRPLSRRVQAFFAMTDIPPMTELTFDYGRLHAEMHKLHDNIADQ